MGIAGATKKSRRRKTEHFLLSLSLSLSLSLFLSLSNTTHTHTHTLSLFLFHTHTFTDSHHQLSIKIKLKFIWFLVSRKKKFSQQKRCWFKMTFDERNSFWNQILIHTSFERQSYKENFILKRLNKVLNCLSLHCFKKIIIVH